MTNGARPLDLLNFFLADVRDGLGPYLAVYLLSERHWNAAEIGTVMSIAGIAGLLAQTRAGALIDATRHKRLVVVAATLLVTLGSLVPLFATGFPLLALSQAISGGAGAVFAPAVAAITLGLVGQRRFAARVGRNEAFNHAGNAAAAGLAGTLGWFYGPSVVFWLMAAMAVCSLVAVLRIPGGAIDDDAARGLTHPAGTGAARPSGLRLLLSSRPLLIFALCCAMFHLANAAMLPLVGQKLALIDPGLATSLMSVCIVAAQVVMVPMAMLVGARADRWGRKPLFLAAIAVLPLRGVLYTLSNDPYWLVSVQLLDGVAAGLFGALFPLVVADLTRGTGHFNLALGAITTAQGVGASASAAIAGLIVVDAGYSAAFLALAGVAATALILFWRLMPETLDQVGPVEAGAPMPALART
jgi:MFS family permease